MTPHRKRVAVIGGGISGLAAAKAFRAKGHEVVIFEQSDGLGGVWRETYPDVLRGAENRRRCCRWGRGDAAAALRTTHPSAPRPVRSFAAAPRPAATPVAGKNAVAQGALRVHRRAVPGVRT